MISTNTPTLPASKEAETVTLVSKEDVTEALRWYESRIEGLESALSDLYATVKGECPSLLNEDSGGDARLDLACQEALAASPGAKKVHPTARYMMYLHDRTMAALADVPEWTEGVVSDGAAILRDGVMIRIGDVLETLNRLEAENHSLREAAKGSTIIVNQAGQRIRKLEAALKMARDCIDPTTVQPFTFSTIDAALTKAGS